MTTTELVPANADQKVAEVESRVAQAQAQANAIEVRNAGEANAATEILSTFAKQRREAETERRALVGPLNATVRRLNLRFKESLAPLDAADKTIRQKVTTYTAEQERIRREEEARLERERQERERKAREERERQEAEARARREAAEREAREAAELAAQDAEVAQLAEEAAQALEEAKTAESAIASLSEPVLPRAIVPETPAMQSESGAVSTRKRWVVKSIVLPLLPDDYKIADEKAITAALRESVRETNAPPEIPGIVFEQVSELAVRAK